MKIDGSGQRKTPRGVCSRAHGKRAGPSGYKLSRAKAFFWPVFGTESRPTGAPEASSRGEGGFWTVFGTATLPTGTSEPSSRGEASPNRSQNGSFPMHQSVFGTESRPTGAPEASRRGEGVFWPVFDTESRPTGATGASRRGKGGFWTVFGTATLPTNRSQNGPFPMHQSVFGTASRPTGAPEASRRGEGRLLDGLRHGTPVHRYLRGILAWRRGLLDGLWHGYPAHRCSRGILAWRRGSSFRPLARLPCPQVPNCYPRGVHKQSADG